MNKSDIIKKVARKFYISEDKAKKAVDEFFAGISEELEKCGNLEVRGFGTFKIKEYGSYVGRNPKSGDSVNVKPKVGVVFKASKNLLESLNNEKV